MLRPLAPDMRFVVEPVVNERQAVLYFQVRS